MSPCHFAPFLLLLSVLWLLSCSSRVSQTGLPSSAVRRRLKPQRGGVGFGRSLHCIRILSQSNFGKITGHGGEIAPKGTVFASCPRLFDSISDYHNPKAWPTSHCPYPISSAGSDTAPKGSLKALTRNRVDELLRFFADV